MFSTNILKNNILRDDPLLNFKKGDIIYVKGEILITNEITGQLKYMLFSDYVRFKITTYGISRDGHIVMVPADSKLPLKDYYIFINYEYAENKMSYPLIEIKTKI